jgi:hypothetical protein
MRRLVSILSMVVLVQLILPTWAFAAQREDINRILKRLEEDTDRFSKSLDDALDHSSLNGTQSEDEINRFVHLFEEATDRLKDRYEDQGAAPVAAREVLNRVQHIDRFMRRNRLGGRAESDWQSVRSDLNLLARTYRINWRW